MNQWIDAKKRQPKDDRDVLVLLPGNAYPQIGWCGRTSHLWRVYADASRDTWFYTNEVTHWQSFNSKLPSRF